MKKLNQQEICVISGGSHPDLDKNALIGHVSLCLASFGGVGMFAMKMTNNFEPKEYRMVALIMIASFTTTGMSLCMMRANDVFLEKKIAHNTEMILKKLNEINKKD